METVIVGADIGQKRDPTAVVVVEVVTPDGQEPVYLVRHLERLPLGTPYPQVAERLVAIVDGAARRLAESKYDDWWRALRQAEAAIILVIDATGVGQPVVELVEQAMGGRAAYVAAVTFAAGDGFRGQRLGKAYMVSRLQVLLQTGRLKLPQTPEAAQLARELQDYEIRVDADAHDTYGAFRTGSHDDLVTALGLAVTQPSRAVQYAPPLWQ